MALLGLEGALKHYLLYYYHAFCADALALRHVTGCADAAG